MHEERHEEEHGDATTQRLFPISVAIIGGLLVLLQAMLFWTINLMKDTLVRQATQLQNVSTDMSSMKATHVYLERALEEKQEFPPWLLKRLADAEEEDRRLQLQIDRLEGHEAHEYAP